jgi:hypothetical protein
MRIHHVTSEDHRSGHQLGVRRVDEATRDERTVVHADVARTDRESLRPDRLAREEHVRAQVPARLLGRRHAWEKDGDGHHDETQTANGQHGEHPLRRDDGQRIARST